MTEPVHPRPAFRVEFPCNLAEVRRAVGNVGHFLAAQGCAKSEITDCELALVEGCNNAVAYATGTGRQQPISLEAECQSQTIELRITDHTPGFDWPASAHLPEPAEERGRGVYLIRSLMDKAEYLRGKNANTLLLRKIRR